MIAPFVIPLAISMAKAFAPALITKIAGDKSGAIAQKVVNIVQVATGTKTAEEAEAVVAADPKIAATLTERLADFDLQETKAFLEDIADARARDVAIVQSGTRNWRGDVLAYIAVVAFVTVIVSLMFLEIPLGGARDLLLVLMGVLGAIVKNVYAFEFGSSRGSKDKDAILGKLNGQGR